MNVKVEGGYTGWGLWDDGSRESSAEEGRNTERRVESDEGGDGKADVDDEVMAGSGQHCGKGRGRMGQCHLFGVEKSAFFDVPPRHCLPPLYCPYDAPQST